MEIKTTDEIWDLASFIHPEKPEEKLTKKWVAVEDILERLNDFQSGCSITVIADIIKELSHK